MKVRRRPSKKILELLEAGGKLLLDLGKVVFGTMFLGGVLRGNMTNGILIMIGIVVSIVLFIIALILTVVLQNHDEEEEEE